MRGRPLGRNAGESPKTALHFCGLAHGELTAFQAASDGFDSLSPLHSQALPVNAGRVLHIPPFLNSGRYTHRMY